MTNQRQSLSIDLDSLFPDDTLTIGSTTIMIHPLTLKQISVLSKKVKALGVPLTEAGITWENFNNTANLVKIIEIIIGTAPELLEEVANVNLEDLKALPMDITLQIVDKVIEVNLRAKELLEKNFKSLTTNFLPQEAKKTLQENLNKK